LQLASAQAEKRTVEQDLDVVEGKYRAAVASEEDARYLSCKIPHIKHGQNFTPGDVG